MLDSGEFGGPEGAFSGGPLGGPLSGASKEERELSTAIA